VAKPRKFSIEEIMRLAPLEERIYRHRCVEGWSIVVPWAGYSLGTLLKVVEPTPKAKFVAFESYYDLKQMPEAKHAVFRCHMSRGSGWTKLCTLWPCCAWACTANRCRPRMARR
jgi:DMSO/TMAO reductase YedYZ molybdopterin-dependent catalytic subunit